VERSKKDLGVGTDNPCNDEDMNLFYGAITITIDNDAKTPFDMRHGLREGIPKI
jgi:hypothetical protein